MDIKAIVELYLTTDMQGSTGLYKDMDRVQWLSTHELDIGPPDLPKF